MNREELSRMLAMTSEPAVTAFFRHDDNGVTIIVDGRPVRTVSHAWMIQRCAAYLPTTEEIEQ